MSYTVSVIPIGRDETDLLLENAVNRVQRHCRIGKVTPKGLPSAIPFHPKPVKDIAPNFWRSWPFNGDARAPAPQYMSKCGCKVGTACSSVSCPHGPVVTC